jgi:hypothetical protein
MLISESAEWEKLIWKFIRDGLNVLVNITNHINTRQMYI